MLKKMVVVLIAVGLIAVVAGGTKSSPTDGYYHKGDTTTTGH